MLSMNIKASRVGVKPETTLKLLCLDNFMPVLACAHPLHIAPAEVCTY